MDHPHSGARRGIAGARGAVLALLLAPAGAAALDFAALRAAMIREIEAEARAIGSAAPALDPAVLAAMGRVPRHEFVPAEYLDQAYEDRPLPIGLGQTISQPYIVALMTSLLGVEKGDSVFELGTGSGYQAAVLAELGAEVRSVEIVAPLAERAGRTLSKLGYGKVEIRSGDGYFGWEEGSRFDAIIVTAAGDHVPPPLLRQLKNGGALVMPVGGPFHVQTLVLVEKDSSGRLSSRDILPVRFVPLTGGPR
jgi:protein-L-isoaspartate(D-aspartate) O-methyltransferase